MFNIFGRGQKKKPESKEQPPDQAILDIMAQMKAKGGSVIHVDGGVLKELSAADIERQQRAREFEKIGDAHFTRDEFPEAITAYKKALDIFPDEVLYMNIGNAYVSMGDFDTGIPYLEKSLEVDPNYERARKNLESAKLYRNKQQRR